MEGVSYSLSIVADLENHLGSRRRASGLSAIELAKAAGVSRQTIHAMESGSFVPNTAVALKMARAMGVSVEDLFTLPGKKQLPRVVTPAAIGSYLPIRDATPKSDAVVLAGCDPGLSILAGHAAVRLTHRNSEAALGLLKSGDVQIAGIHLRDNVAEARRLLPKDSVVIVTFADWEEGIVTAAGNPKGIRCVADLAREDVLLVNRESGSGSRALLDEQLKESGIDGRSVRGYGRTAPGHLAAAWQVYAGGTDVCIASDAAARAFGLNFIPLVSERYDLVIRKEVFELKLVQGVFEALTQKPLRRELESRAGYDTRSTGQRVL